MATTVTLGNVINAVKNNIATIKTAIGNATTSAAGLMSNTDKSKLDGIATGANKTTVDSALSTTSTNPVQNKIVAAQINSLNSSLTNIFIAKPSAAKWTDAAGVYFYEGADTTTYSIPYEHCVVMYIGVNGTSARAAAIAIRWTRNAVSSSLPILWINRKHDSWVGWTVIA